MVGGVVCYVRASVLGSQPHSKNQEVKISYEWDRDLGLSN